MKIGSGASKESARLRATLIIINHSDPYVSAWDEHNGFKKTVRGSRLLQMILDTYPLTRLLMEAF